MKSSQESRLNPYHEIQLRDAVSVVQPAEPESKQGPNTATPSQAESLLAAEKRTLEMMANGASLSEVLNDLCAAIDAHAPPVTSMVCLMDGQWLSPCAGPHVPATFKAAITPWRIGPDRASCGAAAFTKQRVIVPNISRDPRWPDDARDLTLTKPRVFRSLVRTTHFKGWRGAGAEKMTTAGKAKFALGLPG